ncbi:MAG: MATE family efflux transporter [Actinobacteria bacterium]|nr:MATE family efflux transporter [Actinomycetota bacterium]
MTDATNRSRDRRIIALAIPALGALAAEPTYLLVDTAIVGHLGTTQLAALALAATFLSSAFWLFNFLAYGTTAQVSRLYGTGDREATGAVAAQAMWLALAIGLALVAAGEVLAPQIVALLQGEGAVAEKAETYMRISFLGAPFVMVVLAGEGYLRGVQRMVTPLKILVVSNLANVALELWFVYGLDMDIAGSAWGTVIAQAGAAAAFTVVLLRSSAGRFAPVWARMRSLVAIGGDLVVRTGALLVVFNVTVALLAAQGPVPLAAHQVLLQLFILLALALDALAIAAQTLVGSRLGAGDAAEARALARRVALISLMTGIAAAVVLLAGRSVIPDAFTDDLAVVAEIGDAWLLFVLMLPFNALVFAWDGVLVGAGDTRFMMLAMIAAAATCLPVAAFTIGAGWGVVGAWTGIAALIGVRFVTNLVRVEGGRWAVTGEQTAKFST